MYRVIAVLACGVSLAACSSSWVPSFEMPSFRGGGGGAASISRRVRSAGRAGERRRGELRVTPRRLTVVRPTARSTSMVALNWLHAADAFLVRVMQPDRSAARLERIRRRLRSASIRTRSMSSSSTRRMSAGAGAGEEEAEARPQISSRQDAVRRRRASPSAERADHRGRSPAMAPRPHAPAQRAAVNGRSPLGLGLTSPHCPGTLVVEHLGHRASLEIALATYLKCQRLRGLQSFGDRHGGRRCASGSWSSSSAYSASPLTDPGKVRRFSCAPRCPHIRRSTSLSQSRQDHFDHGSRSCVPCDFGRALFWLSRQSVSVARIPPGSFANISHKCTRRCLARAVNRRPTWTPLLFDDNPLIRRKNCRFSPTFIGVHPAYSGEKSENSKAWGDNVGGLGWTPIHIPQTQIPVKCRNSV